MAIISEFFRFILSRSPEKASAFEQLRKLVSQKGSPKAQYFAYGAPVHGWDKPQDDLMCWYIEWPEPSSFRHSDEFKSELVKLADSVPRSLLFEFSPDKRDELVKALKAPFCEFAYVGLAPHAPRLSAEFERSMNKTCTDCYLAPGGGLAGGIWDYAINTNDPAGEEVVVGKEGGNILDVEQRRVAIYILGWQSTELHLAYQQTDLYSEEIEYLVPFFGSGSSAVWTNLQEEH